MDGTKLDANASKIKSVRYDRIGVLRKKLAHDIAELMEQAEAADNSPEEDGLCKTVGKPDTLLADSGYAGEAVVKHLQTLGIEPLIAITREQQERPYDFRPPPDEKRRAQNRRPKAITAPWRLAMSEKLKTEDAKTKYRRRKSTVEPVFGIIKSVLGFTKFSLRGIENVKSEWQLVTLAYNVKRLARMRTA